MWYVIPNRITKILWDKKNIWSKLYDLLIRYFHEPYFLKPRLFQEILHNICFEFFQNCGKTNQKTLRFVFTFIINKNCKISEVTGPIFLRRFKLYTFSFTFGFMFANICFEKNQNSKIYVMFIINITWNETGICSFWAVWAVRAVGKNQVLTFASLVC